VIHQPAERINKEHVITPVVPVVGYGAGYKYNHDVDATDQTYLPDELIGTSFFGPSSQRPSAN